jgi:hypothetical protein
MDKGQVHREVSDRQFCVSIMFEFLRAMELHELPVAAIGGVCEGEG